MVFLPREPGELEGAVEPVVRERALAVNLRRATHRANEVVLDAWEVVLGLRVGKPEDGAWVGSGEDVRDAVSVAMNRDRLRHPLPARPVRDRKRLGLRRHSGT